MDHLKKQRPRNGKIAVIFFSFCVLMLILHSWGCSSDNGGGEGRYFRFAIVSDPHIIDIYYKGPESTPVDTESMWHTWERLENARDQINALDPPVEAVFIPGDYMHNYASSDWDFYVQHETRIDIAKTITDQFNCPVYVGLGNHDYDIPSIPREFTQNLFQMKFGMDSTYYYVDMRGWRFIMLDDYLGDTQNPSSPDYFSMIGSFGYDQLLWLDGVLAEGKPAFVFFHQPLFLLKWNESPGLGILDILNRYQDTVAMVFAGHLHYWVDFEYMFGPRHWAVGSTRYDENSFVIVEVDSLTMDYRILNEGCIHWLTRTATRYDPQEGCK